MKRLVRPPRRQKEHGFMSELCKIVRIILERLTNVHAVDRLL